MKPVNATKTREGWDTTGLSHADYARMQTEKHNGWHPTAPPWSKSNEKTQRVIAAQIVAGRLIRPGADLAGIRETEKTVLESWRKAAERSAETAVRIKAVERAGGLAEFLAGIIYRSYRLAQDSPTVAGAMEIKPQSVRQVLVRLNRTARRLFPNDCLPPRPWNDKLVISQTKRRKKGGNPRIIDIAEAVRMRRTGRKLREIAERFDVANPGVVSTALLRYERRRKAKAERLGVAYVPLKVEPCRK